VDSLPEEYRANPAAFLAPQEQETLRGLHFSKRRQDWLLGRWAAKVLLRQSENTFSSLAYEAITIGKEPEGAPYFEVDGKRLSVCVSLSHRAGLAVCALVRADTVQMGIDIEKIEHHPEIFVRDYFTEREISSLGGVVEAEKDTWVTLAWSGKEAVFKALRKGLYLDTRSAEIGCPPDLRIATDAGAEHARASGIGDGWLPLQVAFSGDSTMTWWSAYQAWGLTGGDKVILTLAACAKGQTTPDEAFRAGIQPVRVKTGPPATLTF
jgi:4'-phosphopantetheinyl transferase EntD